MKIVLCCHRFLPRFIGGVEIYTFRLGYALREFGHEIFILTGEPTVKKDLSVDVWADRYEGLPVIRLAYDFDRRPVIYRASYSDPTVTAHIKTILQQLQPDIVHATSLSLLMAGTIEAASDLNIPLVHTAMDRVLICRRGFHLKHDNSICSAKENLALCASCMGPRNGFESWLNRVWQLTPKSMAEPLLPVAERVLGKRADFAHAAESIEYRLKYLPLWTPKIARIIAPSTYTRDMFVLNNFPSAKIVVSPYGVEAPTEDFKKTSSEMLRFGFIGRITPIKGVHLLIKAFALLPDTGKATLTIYGDADDKSQRYMQTLKNKAASFPNISFAGSIDNAEITRAYEQMDILVFPSISPENSPFTVLEAQAYGIPVISSDIKGVADIIQHDVNGLTFQSQDAPDLAAQMARCLGSPELVTRLTEKSRLVKSIQEDANNIIRLYEEVMMT